MKETGLTQESFSQLLNWLNPDQEQAAYEYERIRVRLIKLFVCRGCHEADDLADETINRVATKVDQIRRNYSGNPVLYFCGVANNVHHEYLRRKPVASTSDEALNRLLTADTPASVESDQEYECLESCMEHLSDNNRHLVIEYYQEQKRAKIDHRKNLADQLGIGVNALRIRAHRIRLQLQQCVLECLEKSPAH